MKKKINKILFAGYHSVLWSTLCNEKKTEKTGEKGLLNKWYQEYWVAIGEGWSEGGGNKGIRPGTLPPDISREIKIWI